MATAKILHVWPSLDQRSGGPLRAILDLSANAARFGLDSEVLGFGPVNVPDNPLDPSLLERFAARAAAHLRKLPCRKAA